MTLALEEAGKAGKEGEVPVGALLVKGDQVVARDHNRCIALNDPTAHAEILVLRRAGKILRNYRLKGTTLYVTVEPCPMCASAMIHGRIARLVYGAPEPKFGAVKSKMRLFQKGRFNHVIETEQGILRRECTETLRCFFKRRRQDRKAMKQ